MRNLKLWACAAALALMATAPVFIAQPAQAQLTIQKVEKKPEKPKTRAAPSPVAGIGLPVALLAGGYFWLRNRRRNRKGSD